MFMKKNNQHRTNARQGSSSLETNGKNNKIKAMIVHNSQKHSSNPPTTNFRKEKKGKNDFHFLQIFSCRWQFLQKKKTFYIQFIKSDERNWRAIQNLSCQHMPLWMCIEIQIDCHKDVFWNPNQSSDGQLCKVGQLFYKVRWHVIEWKLLVNSC